MSRILMWCISVSDVAARVIIWVLSGAMILIIIAQVVMRYIIDEPLSWSEELTR
jgi:TRAP-type C4-dicarboxylate transport system permease small subunit